jgi:hypothetical protein
MKRVLERLSFARDTRSLEPHRGEGSSERVKPPIWSAQGLLVCDERLKVALIAFCAVTACAAIATSCKDREACERSRLEVAEQWENLKASALRRKLVSAEEEGKKGQIENWTEIEKDAETMATSFQTPQVTWNAADKSRAAIDKELAEVASATDMGYKAFERAFKEASKQTDQFAEQCR